MSYYHAKAKNAKAGKHIMRKRAAIVHSTLAAKFFLLYDVLM